jgi:hypothetical protein
MSVRLRRRNSRKSSVPIIAVSDSMVFDHEVEKVGSPGLYRGIKRLAAKGLFDGAQYAV